MFEFCTGRQPATAARAFSVGVLKPSSKSIKPRTRSPIILRELNRHDCKPSSARAAC